MVGWTATAHRRMMLDGYEVFWREAGPADAPAVLLPHGYPCSSYAYRNLLPLLGDRWRLVAPDFPGAGYSGTPDGFAYDFDGYAAFLARFADTAGLGRFALYLHDFGSQVGLRLAMLNPRRVTALVIQNGDIYEDALGPKYEGLRAYWENPTEEGRAKLAAAVSEEGYRHEFVGEVRSDLAKRITPDLWHLHWALTTPRRRDIMVGLIAGLRENLAWFPRYQAYLRENQPPTLIVWGPQDGYMPEAAARAYLRDLPGAELRLLDAGHWALETSLDEVATAMRDFLGRHHRG